MHVEWQTQNVAFRQQVREAVDVCDDVVRLLEDEVGEEVLQGFGEDKRTGERLCRRGRSDDGVGGLDYRRRCRAGE